jgi:hypothetical protein
MQNFKDVTVKQITFWAWIAAVLPVTSLASMFFVWAFGTEKLFDIVMVVGSTAMFAISVVWWWWALYVIKKLIVQWDTTEKNVEMVLVEINDIAVTIRSVFTKKLDK